MKLHALLLVAISLLSNVTLADGEGDNNPDAVRQVPRVGVQVSEEDRTLLKKGLAELCLLYTSPSPRDS